MEEMRNEAFENATTLAPPSLSHVAGLACQSRHSSKQVANQGGLCD